MAGFGPLPSPGLCRSTLGWIPLVPGRWWAGGGCRCEPAVGACAGVSATQHNSLPAFVYPGGKTGQKGVS